MAKQHGTLHPVFTLASQAMAKLSSGIVYIMLTSDSQGTHWLEETEWNKQERPNLDLAVTEVIRVNPDNDDQETIKGGTLTRPQCDPVSSRLQP